MAVQVPVEEAMPLGPGEYYEHEILGLAVCTEDGEPLGVVDEVLYTGSNAVYVTRGPLGEVLIPVLNDVVLEVDLEAERLVVRLPPGLLE
jgi:16S rRNA processing protein RimM